MSARDIFRRFGLSAPRWVPAANVLVGLNLAYMLVAMALFGAHNLFQPESEMLYRMGALVPAAFFAGEYWRLITYGFLHIGLLHIVFNMVALSQVGPAIESEVGSSRFVAVYLLSLIGGGVADLVVRGPAVMLIAGASGALFGLIGFGIAYAHFYGGHVGRMQRNFFLPWAAYGLVFAFLVGADNICHLGGLLVGGLCGFLVERERARRPLFDAVWFALAALLSFAAAAAFGWLLWRSL
jgi:rhomboid protease GluP